MVTTLDHNYSQFCNITHTQINYSFKDLKILSLVSAEMLDTQALIRFLIDCVGVGGWIGLVVG